MSIDSGTRPAPRDLALLDAVAQAELVRRGEVTATELVEAAIERIEAVNPALNAVIHPTFDQALARAATRPAGPLGGVPYLLKDLVAEQSGVGFTEGSRFLAGNVSRVTSDLVHRLERAGLIILGRTNSAEFGLLPACEPQLYGPTRNPWSLGHSTSGSSGGSAAAVAAGLVPAAHANDLGGSIRYPASACGLFGLKPTRARVPLGPLYGDVLNGMAIEHAVTRTVRDSAALLDAVTGPDLGDPYPAPATNGPLSAQVGLDPGRLRIAWSVRRADGQPAHPDCAAAVAETVVLLEELGHDVVQADLPGLTGQVGAAIGTLFDAASAWIVDYWVRQQGREPGEGELEPLTRAYWQAGRAVSAAAYLHAVQTTQRFARVVAGFLTRYDAYLTPTLSTPPTEIGWITSTPEQPRRALERGGRTIAHAGVVANLTGNPAMSVPLWWNGEGLPIGVHLLGRFGDEATLIRLASQLEAARPWTDRVPPVHAAVATPMSKETS